MQSEQVLKHLLNVLRSHHIALTDEGKDIRLAFEAESSREHITAWVQQYLGRETLLSFEEAQLYSRLEKQDLPSRIGTDYDLSVVRPLLDEDFETSLRLLEASTSAIEEQTRTLKFQQEVLAKFQKNDGRVHAQLRRTIGLRQQHLLKEKQSTSLAVDGLLQNLTKNLSIAQHELQNIRNTSRKNISDSLKYDDNKLSKIVKLASGLGTSDDEDRPQASNVEALCAQLKAYITNGIRCHLDRVYLETIQSSPYEASQPSENTDLETSLKTELGTLYTEIDDVAQMAINHEFCEPLCDMIKKEEILREDRIREIFDNMDATMNHVQEKIENNFLQLQAHNSHCLALSTIIDELNNLGLEKSKDSFRSPKQRVPLCANKYSSLHEMAPRDGFDSSKLTGIEEDPTEQNHRQLLQILGCPLSENSNIHDIQDMLDHTAYIRSHNARIGLLKLSKAINSSLDLTLDTASITNQIVVDEVFEDTKWQEVQFLDDHLRSRIVELETKIGSTGSAMGDLDLDKSHVDSKESQDFVNNWKV